MLILLQILFWISLLAIGHTYVAYPLLVNLLAKNKPNNPLIYHKSEELPQVSILMSLYNEEAVIHQKIATLLDIDYPSDKLHCYIGSDNSSDATNEIVRDYQNKYPHLISFLPFNQRQGKPGVINTLANTAIQAHNKKTSHIFIITDASVLLTKDTVWQLIKHFKNPEIGIVDSNMITTGLASEGISKSERHYINSEVQLKHNEGRLWGKMIGPFGGCYALRARDYTQVPDNTLVDDFYIAMKVFENKKQAISELKATCYEKTSQALSEEYRRKSRISAGNFQNMSRFFHLWFPPVTTLGFAFFSHKILRWLTPIFGITTLLTAVILAWKGNLLYQLVFCCQLIILVVIPTLDKLFQAKQINWYWFRNIRYFIMMNMALLEGLFKFLKGVKTSIWQPPKRT